MKQLYYTVLSGLTLLFGINYAFFVGPEEYNALYLISMASIGILSLFFLQRL